MDSKKDKLSENHYTVLDENAGILSDYVKIHPFSYSGENKFFVPGEQIVLFDYGEYM